MNELNVAQPISMPKTALQAAEQALEAAASSAAKPAIDFDSIVNKWVLEYINASQAARDTQTYNYLTTIAIPALLKSIKSA